MQWLSWLGLYCGTAPVSLCPIPLRLIYCACSLTSTDGSTGMPKKPVMEHADEAQWKIFPVFSAMAVSSAQPAAAASRQEGCSGCAVKPRWPQANANRADAVLAKWQVATRAKQEQELCIALNHSPVAWTHLKKNRCNSKLLWKPQATQSDRQPKVKGDHGRSVGKQSKVLRGAWQVRAQAWWWHLPASGTKHGTCGACPHCSVLQWGWFPGKYRVFLHRLMPQPLLEILWWKSGAATELWRPETPRETHRNWWEMFQPTSSRARLAWSHPQNCCSSEKGFC